MSSLDRERGGQHDYQFLVSFASFPVLPGGRNSGQKVQKGPGKTTVGRKNLWLNFWPNFAKSGGKGAEEKFLKIPYFQS
jgi:hypothetical protein